MTVFENLNPTPAEKELFGYAGWYRTEDGEETLVYSSIRDVRKPRPFPTRIETSGPDRDDGRIVFYKSCENVVFEGRVWTDSEILRLILDRMKELGWRMC